MSRLKNRGLCLVICLSYLLLLTACSSDDEQEAGSASIETISTEIISRNVAAGDDFVTDLTIDVTYPVETNDIENFSKNLIRWAIEGNKAKLTYNQGVSSIEIAYLMVDAPTSTQDKSNFTKAVVSANGKTYNLYVQIEHSNSLIEDNQTSPIRINISN